MSEAIVCACRLSLIRVVISLFSLAGRWRRGPVKVGPMRGLLMRILPFSLYKSRADVRPLKMWMPRSKARHVRSPSDAREKCRLMAVYRALFYWRN